MAHRPKFWKCHSCLRLLEAKEFTSFDLHSKCLDCQRATSGYAGGTSGGSPRAVHVKSKRVLKTKRNHDRSEPM
jgi:hypothetical protein